MEEMRRRPDAGKGNDSIRNQFEFVKICCDVAKLDLTDFFDKWGFFYVGEIKVNDYGMYRYKITQPMVDDCKSYIARKTYKRPATDITRTEDSRKGLCKVPSCEKYDRLPTTSTARMRSTVC